jgi:hypothetical protein
VPQQQAGRGTKKKNAVVRSPSANYCTLKRFILRDLQTLNDCVLIVIF